MKDEQQTDPRDSINAAEEALTLIRKRLADEDNIGPVTREQSETFGLPMFDPIRKAPKCPDVAAPSDFTAAVITLENGKQIPVPFSVFPKDCFVRVKEKMLNEILHGPK